MAWLQGTTRHAAQRPVVARPAMLELELELELRTGRARFPNVTLSLFDPPHLRQAQDHSPSRHGPHPARHGWEEGEGGEGGGGVPGVGASSGTAHDISYISGPPRRPPGALLRLLPYTVDINHLPRSL